MIGIVSYGFYIPRYRITTEEISTYWGKDGSYIKKSLGIEEKAIAGMDEDVLTMAYEASSSALEGSGVSANQLGAVFVGSENHPYVVNPTSTILAEYLGVGNEYLAYDTEFACKGATGVLLSTLGLVQSDMVSTALVVGSDKATGKPGDALEFSAASASVALVVGNVAKRSDCILAFEHGLSFSSDTPDFWRRDGNLYPMHGGRFTGKPAYFKHISGATQAILKKALAKPADFDHAIFHMPNGKFPLEAARMLGFTSEQLKHSLVVGKLGNSYSACALMGLSAVLDHAVPKQKILMVSYGSGAGSDAFIFTVEKGIEKKRHALAHMIKQKEYVHYGQYMKFMNMV